MDGACVCSGSAEKASGRRWWEGWGEISDVGEVGKWMVHVCVSVCGRALVFVHTSCAYTC